MAKWKKIPILSLGANPQINTRVTLSGALMLTGCINPVVHVTFIQYL